MAVIEYRLPPPVIRGTCEISVEEFYEYARSLNLPIKRKGSGAEFRAKTIECLDNDVKSESETMMVDHLFQEGELVLMSAETKVGKTLLAMDLALMTSTGGSICSRLKAIRSYPTLYIDTELPGERFKDRLSKLIGNYESQGKLAKNFRYITVRSHPKIKLDLSASTGQKWVENVIEDAKFIVFDNLGGFIPYGAEKNEKKWSSVSNWLKSLTSKGITVLLVHHVNKDGEQRGTGKITDDVDLVISLERPKSCPREKTIIKFNVTHARYLYGDDCASFSLEYITENGKTRRTILTDDAEPERLAAHCNSLVSDVETSSLTPLQVEMLREARGPVGYITAGLFKNKNKGKGRSPSTVTSSLADLCSKGLLCKDGKGSGMKYYPAIQPE